MFYLMPNRDDSPASRRADNGFTLAFMLALAMGLMTAGSFGYAASSNKTASAKTIALIGAGHVGKALGTLWAAAGYHVIFATRHPNELGEVVKTAGHGAKAAAVGKAVKAADIVVLAVPYHAEPSISKRYSDAMKGKVLVDVDNAFRQRDGAVAAKAKAVGEAIYSARLFNGTRFIRAFNRVGAGSYPEPNAVKSANFKVPYTTNDKSVRPIAEALIRATGGTPQFRGGLANAQEL